MGVFCTDRLTGLVLGMPNLLFALVRDALAALGAPHLDVAGPGGRDGYVPSWLARTWADLLFTDLGELVVVARPARGRPGEMRPVAVYRTGSPAALHYARAGEQLSVYDLPCAPVLLTYAQFCSGGTGHTTTTLRPPALHTPLSPVAARTLQVRSGLFPAPPPTRRTA